MENLEIDIMQEAQKIINKKIIAIKASYVDQFDGRTKYITQNEDGTSSEFTVKVIHLRTSAVPKE